MNIKAWPAHLWALILFWTGLFLFFHVPGSWNRISTKLQIKYTGGQYYGLPLNAFFEKRFYSELTTGQPETKFTTNYLHLAVNIFVFASIIGCLILLTTSFGKTISVREIALVVVFISVCFFVADRYSGDDYLYPTNYYLPAAIYWFPLLFAFPAYLYEKRLSSARPSEKD